MRQPGRCFLTWVLAFRDPALFAWLGFSEQGGLGWDLTLTQVKAMEEREYREDRHK